MSHLTLSEQQLDEYLARRLGLQTAYHGERQDGTAATPGPTKHGNIVLTTPETARAGCVTLTLPKPVSANLYWRTFLPKGHTRPIVTLSDQAKAYKAQVKQIARHAGITTPLAGRIELTQQTK